jgi:hypothetical protein
VERLKALFCEDEWGIFGWKMHEGSSNLREIVNESLIKSCMFQKATNPLHIGGRRYLFNYTNLCLIYLDPFLQNFMPKDNSFSDHEMTLLPVWEKVGHLTPLQHFIEVCQAILECFAGNGEIIHEHLHDHLDQVKEYHHHAPLK